MQEPEICEIVQYYLEVNGIPFKREKRLGKNGRIDFGIHNVIGIECKGELSCKAARKNPQSLVNQINKYKLFYTFVWLVLPNNFWIADVADKVININFFKDNIYDIDKLIGNSI